MPSHSYILNPDGLAIPAMIGLNGPQTQALVQAGLPIPAPILARALLDTGSDVTAVDRSILQSLLTPSIQSTSTQTASGPLPVNLFQISLSILDTAGSAGPFLLEADLLVMELPMHLADIDVLIGRDIMLRWNLHLNGPGRQFTITF